MTVDCVQAPTDVRMFWAMALGEGIALDERERCAQLLNRCAQTDALDEWRRQLRSSWAGLVQMDGESAPLLHHAATRPHDGWVRLLLTLGAHPHQTDMQGAWAIEWAARAPSEASFMTLLGQGLSPTQTLLPPQPTLVHDLVRHGTPLMLHALAEHGLPWPRADWDVPDEQGCYPMHWAADRNDMAVLHALQEMGASWTVTDRQGQNAQQRHARQFPQDRVAFLAQGLQDTDAAEQLAQALAPPPPFVPAAPGPILVRSRVRLG